MPAAGRIWPAIVFQIMRSRFGCHRRRLFRIETECHDFEFAPGIEFQNAKALDEAVETHRAERGTRKVDRRENHGLAVKEIAEMERSSGFIAKRQAQVDRRIK